MDHQTIDTNITTYIADLSHDDIVRYVGTGAGIEMGVSTEQPGATTTVLIDATDPNTFSGRVSVVVDHNYKASPLNDPAAGAVPSVPSSGTVQAPVPAAAAPAAAAAVVPAPVIMAPGLVIPMAPLPTA